MRELLPKVDRTTKISKREIPMTKTSGDRNRVQMPEGVMPTNIERAFRIVNKLARSW